MGGRKDPAGAVWESAGRGRPCSGPTASSQTVSEAETAPGAEEERGAAAASGSKRDGVRG